MSEEIKTSEDVKKYCKETCIKLIEKHQDIIQKTFKIIDRDKLDEEIEKAIDSEDNKSESTVLTKIQNRKKALNAVEDSIEKIDALSRHLDEPEKPEATKTENNNSGKSPVKQFSKKN
jgi:hypothetical protein